MGKYKTSIKVDEGLNGQSDLFSGSLSHNEGSHPISRDLSVYEYDERNVISLKVSMNRQNNNKAKSQLDNKSVSETDEFHSGLLEALEFVERKRTPCILPKRSSYSFKELDVLKKLKSSIVAKKAESKLNRRKTWSAGSFPISSCTVLEKFRKPISDGDIIDPQKEKEDIIRELASKVILFGRMLVALIRACILRSCVASMVFFN